MNRILIAVDGSAGARAALAAGIELARDADADVTIATVRHEPIPVLGDPYYQRALTHELARAREVLDEALEVAEEARIHAEGEILEGDPGEEIVRLARHRDVDLVVVGSRGLGSVAGAVFGSVSRFVVRHADRPVLVVKEPAVVPAL